MRSKDQSDDSSMDDDLDELFELDKQDEATLSPSQKKKLEDSSAKLVGAFNRTDLAPRIDPSLVALHGGISTKDIEDNIEEWMDQQIPLNLQYDRDKRVLTIDNKHVVFGEGTYGEIICKKLFRSGKPVKHPVEKGEIMDVLSVIETDKDIMRKTLYNRVASVNRVIYEATGVKKLFDYVDRKLWFNPKYFE